MATRSNDPGAGRQPSNERFDPGANHGGTFVVDENDVDAAIGKHALRVFAVAADRLRPETQQIPRQRWKWRVLAVFRSSCAIHEIKYTRYTRPSSNRF